MNDIQHKEAITQALKRFGNTNLAENARNLLNTLDYRSTRTIALEPNTADGFVGAFDPNGKMNPERAQVDEWESIDFLFQLTEEEITGNGSVTMDFGNSEVDQQLYQSYLFFVLKLRRSDYARTQLSTVTRELNKLTAMPALVIFQHGSTLTFAIIDRRLHKRDESRDVLEKVTLIKDINFSEPHRAHIEILFDLSLSELSRQHRFTNFPELHQVWKETLDTEALNKEFYRKLFGWFEWAVSEARFPTKEKRTLSPQEHVIRLITRLLFIWFIKEKKLVAADLFDDKQIEGLLKNFDRGSGDSYYRAVLQNLFFTTLNTEINERRFSTRTNAKHRDFSCYRYKDEMRDPDTLLALFAQTPFINGGLFDCLDSVEANGSGGYRIDCFSDVDYKKSSVPDRLFFDEARGLFPLLDHYKFTVEENTPIEQEVALDPELLGKVFENLLAAYNPETGATARKQTGSYYTPRVIVDYMVEEGLVATLAGQVQPTDGDAKFWDERLHYLLDYAKVFDDASVWFDDDELDGIVRAISELKILDPAVGSGAFPMGVLHKLALALRRLDPDNSRWEQLQKERAIQRTEAAFDTKDDETRREELLEIDATFKRYRDSDFGRKLYLIQNSIFGVDIQSIACQIAKLRFFISLTIEQEPDTTAENLGVKPLPNLETRFIAANTLLGLEGERMLTSPKARDLERELSDNRERYFHATTRRQKLECKKKDQVLREELAAELKSVGMPADDAEKIAHWDLYDQSASADWFDPEWMFGVGEGFDVVIGNPPYISHDKISKQLKAQIKSHYHSYQPFADVYCYFIEKAVELQNEGGVLSFITSNSYLKAEYGAPIRRLLQSKNMLLRVLSIEDSQVFESVIVNVAIIVSRKQTNLTDDFCIVVNSPFSGNSFEDFVKSNGFNYPQAYFNSKSWTLVKPQFVELQRKLESSGKTLEQLRTKIRLGIATGSNEAFLVDEDKKRNLCEKSPVNAEIIKPILRGRDISRYSYTLSGQHILLAKNGVNVKRDYPEIYKHLDSFGDKFRNRGAQGQHWTNLRACSFYDDFKKEKIVWIELTDFGRFALCNEEVYLLNSAYFLLPPSGMDSKFLLGVLNSSPIRFYLGLVAETSGMGTSRWINNYVKEFPIPVVGPEQQTRIIKIVDQILDAKRADPDADVSTLEDEIDQQVYSLYNLTAEEVAIVEE